MRPLKIYPKTHPYVAVMRGGNIYHLTQPQFEAITSKIDRGQGSAVITYHDPEGSDRKLPLNLFAIQQLDLATQVQASIWRSNGGYICNDGRLVGSEEDCRPKRKEYDPTSMMTSKDAWEEWGEKGKAYALAGYLVGRYNKYGNLELLKVMGKLKYNRQMVERKLRELEKYGLENAEKIIGMLDGLKITWERGD